MQWSFRALRRTVAVALTVMCLTVFLEISESRADTLVAVAPVTATASDTTATPQLRLVSSRRAAPQGECKPRRKRGRRFRKGRRRGRRRGHRKGRRGRGHRRGHRKGPPPAAVPAPPPAQ